MVVAVDTFYLSPCYRHTGTGVYLSNLLSECLRISECSGLKIEFRGFSPRGERWNSDGLASRLFSVRESWAAAHRRLWLLGGMALATSRERPDLVFLPTAHASIPNPFAPVVTTFFDVMHARLPAWMLDTGRSAPWLARINARQAQTIITISSWSKRDLVDVLNVDPDVVEVTYLGYDKHAYNSFSPNPDGDKILFERLGIHKPYVLHHGMVQIRKNLIRLIQAWEHLTESPGALETQLVLAGPPGLGFERIQEKVAVSPYRKRIILTGALDDADMAAVVKNAFLCVIPSLYEGFCLPLVEAMACGVPTVASNSSCIPEVSGGVLEYFDPVSVDEMAEVIRRALEDSELRERLRWEGLARAAEFTWERCARQTLEILARATTDHGRNRTRRSRS